MLLYFKMVRYAIVSLENFKNIMLPIIRYIKHWKNCWTLWLMFKIIKHRLDVVIDKDMTNFIPIGKVIIEMQSYGLKNMQTIDSYLSMYIHKPNLFYLFLFNYDFALIKKSKI